MRNKIKETGLSAQQRLKSDLAHAQSDQSLRYAHEKSMSLQRQIERKVTILNRLDECLRCFEFDVRTSYVAFAMHEPK